MTTIPSRLDTIKQALASVKSQVLQFDAIVVAIPDAARRWPDRPLTVPQFLLDDDKVTVVRGADYGPGTKLILALQQVASHPEDIVIAFDDDDFYYAGVASNLLKYAMQHTDSIIAHQGYNLKGAPPRHRNFNYIEAPGDVTKVDIIAGFRGVSYRKRFIPANTLSEQLVIAPQDAMWVDDDFISGCAGVARVPRLAVPQSYEALGLHWILFE